MIAPSRLSSPPVGRLTGLVLGCVVFICLLMIGLAGYLKYELDRAETTLVAPESVSNSNQEGVDKLRRSLGFSGFVGSAQSFAATHEAGLLPDMKAQIKAANDAIARLPERTSVEARHDLQAIVATFEAADQKAEKSSTDPTVTFTAADIAPLYAALPVLDARLLEASAVVRYAAQGRLEFWAMLLTLVSWGSLIIASAMAAGIYLSLRDRNSAPLRALAQSIKNMAQGDMRTSIWGMERQDMIGEVARTVDMARYHFSQLPDMSVISDQGPVRLRFEGNTKSLFEAMMKVISRDSEQVRHQATSLAEAVNGQQQAISAIASQVESVLHDILQRGHDGNQQVRHVLEDMESSSLSLKHAQEHAADQLNRIIPYLHERANGLAEIAQITGKQVSQALQSLLLSERGLKTSAEQSDIAIKKLSSTADDLSGRLFGAVNLLQASGKVLSETTESTQSRLNEAIEKLNVTVSSIVTSPPAPAAAPPATVMAQAAAPVIDTSFIDAAAPRIEALIESLESAQKKLSDALAGQTDAARAQIDLLTTHSSGLLAQTATTTQTLAAAANHLRDEQLKFDQNMRDIGHIVAGKIETIGAKLQEQADAAFSRASSTISNMALVDQNHSETQNSLGAIAAQIEQMAGKLAELAQLRDVRPEPLAGEPVLSGELLLEIRSGFETTARSLGQVRDQLMNMVINVQTQMPITAASGEAPWQQIEAQIDAVRNQLTQLITHQTEKVESRLAGLAVKTETPPPAISRETQEQMEQQTQILTELVATLGILDAHMQQIKSDMHATRA